MARWVTKHLDTITEFKQIASGSSSREMLLATDKPITDRKDLRTDSKLVDPRTIRKIIAGVGTGKVAS